ncbi:hypothetical protein ANCDUO_13663 [Ancylostoma duodenale]|uniref:RRM domain-containing protein n=1 Tax=Ancylostoma duodenale TaxID=51022 RepID=A0A0C2GGD1_9BILA|nr:hypothetical protein ANCDUO_13663 [Ancylostoma duodenale]
MGRDDSRVYVGNLPPDVREKDIEDIFAKYGKIRFIDIKGGRGPLYAFIDFDDPRMGRDDSRVYVGNLPPDVREKDIEDIFAKYGKIRFIDIKGGRGPLYAFIDFDDPRDADDAVRGRDGYDFDGCRLRVEFTRGVGPRGPGGRPLNGGYGGGAGEWSGPRRGGPPARRSNFRVIVEGLPATGSWQDLKDHMREAGDVCYADVARDGTGVVEFTRLDDMKYAVRKLDDTKFRSHEVLICSITQ